MNINIYKTKEELSDKLSNYIINNHLNNSIALSGGSTPLLLFKNLNKKLAKHQELNTKRAAARPIKRTALAAPSPAARFAPALAVPRVPSPAPPICGTCAARSTVAGCTTPATSR